MAGLGALLAESVAGRLGLEAFELVPRNQVEWVRDEAHALSVLQRGTRMQGLEEQDLHRIAQALATGELLLLRRDPPLPLDPPDPNAVPLLSDLIDDDDAPTSEPSSETVRTWFEVQIVDGANSPLGGVEVVLTCDGDAQRLTTDGDGRVRIDDATARSATISIPRSDALIEALEQSWARPSTDALEPGEHLDVMYYRDALVGPVRLTAEAPHTVSIQPHVAVGRIDGMPFAAERDFVLPGGVVAIAEVIEAVGGTSVVVTAHAEDAALSERRAQRVRELLEGDTDGWSRRYEDGVDEAERWGAAEDAFMLRSLVDAEDPDPVASFQEAQGLEATGRVDTQTRAALIEQYMAKVSLPAGATVETTTRIGAEQIELFFFDATFGVQPPASDPAAHDTWTQRVRVEVERSPSADAPGRLVPILQAEDVHFGNERVVFLPEPPRDPSSTEEPGSGVTGLAVARAVLQQADLQPTKKLVFVGHADALGSTDTNLTVSRDRAENVKLFVTGDRAGWAEHCMSHYAVDDVQNILLWAAATWGWDTHPGTVDNDLGSLTQGALDRFRVEYNAEFERSIPEQGAVSSADWEAFFDLLQATLEAMLADGAPALSELQAGLKLLGEGVIACGEAWAHEPILMTDYPESSLRRVDVLFLDEHEAVLAGVESEPPLRELYGTPLAIARPLDVGAVPFSQLEYEVWAALRSHWGDLPVAGVQYELIGPHPTQAIVREGVADDGGELRESKLLAGNYELRIDGKLIPVASRIMGHHPDGLDAPSHVRIPERDDEGRPLHLFATPQPGEWIVPGLEQAPGVEEPDPRRENGVSDE